MTGSMLSGCSLAPLPIGAAQRGFWIPEFSGWCLLGWVPPVSGGSLGKDSGGGAGPESRVLCPLIESRFKAGAWGGARALQGQQDMAAVQAHLCQGLAGPGSRVLHCCAPQPPVLGLRELPQLGPQAGP